MKRKFLRFISVATKKSRAFARLFFVAYSAYLTNDIFRLC